ncbi:BTB/POZ domain-containing protein 9-like isoform X2 [Dysidea avara]|uniref:BTB/POZ domain-containing protein 9-like isoform X2 n=1 Tax=Dysidea avara TaxID=196820 RepID=UPI00331F67DE
MDEVREPSAKRLKKSLMEEEEDESLTYKEKEVPKGIDTKWCSEVLSLVLRDPSTHDVTFKTSDGGSVSAHRVIVAAGSPVFHAMLYGNMKESSQKEIDLPNVDTATLNMLFFFIYTGHVQTTLEKRCYLLQAARYFAIDKLIKLCSNSIGNVLDLDNFSSVVEFAVEHKFDFLLERCLKFIETEAKKVVFTEGFISLRLTVVLTVTKSSKLKIGELNLFLAIVEWSKHQQDKLSEDDIKAVFKQIRYPLIWKSDLLNSVFPTEMADPDLYNSALKYLNGDEYDGPQEQLELRCCFFKVHAIRDTYVESTPRGTLVTMTGRSGCVCCFQVFPEEDNPILFKVLLNRCGGDTSRKFGFNLSDGNREIMRSEISIGQEVDGCIFVHNQRITATIDNKSVSASLLPTKEHRHTEVFLFIGLPCTVLGDQILLHRK